MISSMAGAKKFQKFVMERGNRRFVIEEDLPAVGWYLYVFLDGKCVNDYLQDTLDKAKEFAFEEFGISAIGWKED